MMVFISAGPLEAFGRVAWQLLQDVQERLVFRAHCYLQSDILQYKPAAGDLAYPEKLEMMEVEFSAFIHYWGLPPKAINCNTIGKYLGDVLFTFRLGTGYPDCEHIFFSCRILTYTPFMIVLTSHLILYKL
jgi:hypothetical protein